MLTLCASRTPPLRMVTLLRFKVRGRAGVKRQQKQHIAYPHSQPPFPSPRSPLPPPPSHLQVNHLSHWLLTFELWDLLEKKASSTGDARVVNHTSSASQVPLTAHHGNEGIPFMTRMFKKGFDSGEQSTEDGTTGILHAR